MAKKKDDPSAEFSGIRGLPLGKAVVGDAPGAEIRLPVKTLVLHGLVGGSTGTGKSRAVQLIAEQLEENGVPVFLADLKGDVSGFAFPNMSNAAAQRAKDMGIAFKPAAVETKYWSISDRFIRFRVRLSDIDPVLIARILRLNTTQESNLKMAFIYARQKELPLVDLVDLQNILAYLTKNPDAVAGGSTSSFGVVLRQVQIAVSEGLNEIFGEPAVDLQDILSGGVNVLNLSDWRKRSDLPSILMAFVINKLFNELPDVGGVEKPKLIIFIDEAHYLFQDANPSLINLFITILKQIRSKGIGVFLSSQNPEDIPEKILEQLGCKMEFALRAFTGDELKDIEGIAKAFPPSKSYDLEKELPMLGVGVAFFSPLSEKGVPMGPVKLMIYPPASEMDVMEDKQMKKKGMPAALVNKYNQSIEPERADLSTPLQGVKVPPRRTYYEEQIHGNIQESKADSRRKGALWGKLKWVAVFGVIFLLLFIIIMIALAVIFKLV